MLKGAVVYIHNKAFDWSILEAASEQLGLPPLEPSQIICTQQATKEWAKESVVNAEIKTRPGGRESLSLDQMCQVFKVKNKRQDSGGIHDAGEDAVMLGECVVALTRLAVLDKEKCELSGHLKFG